MVKSIPEEDKFYSQESHYMDEILNPESLCVFGANNSLLTTMGSMQLRNIIAGGFEGNIFPIHPKLDKIQGYKAYKSVLDLPEIPELAFIILPPKIVPEVLEECGQKGIKRAIITSGGFREVGSNGVELSKTISSIAETYEIRFVGPNCLGVYNGWYKPEDKESHFNTMWVYDTFKRGNVSIASQSGTIACHTVWHAEKIGLKVGKSISIGNELNIDLVDYLDYFKDDPQTDVIGLYIEEVKRGREFVQLAREITPDKPIVAIYAGGTEAAARSIKSHTGAMGGEQKIYDAVFKETGIIATDSIMDFLYYLRTLAFATKYDIFPKGNKVGIITDSGGSGSMMVKTAEMYGLQVPKFSQDLQEKLREDIPPTASALNPLDVTFDMNFYNLFVKFPKTLMNSGEIDSVIIYGVFDFGDVMRVVRESGLPYDDRMDKMSKNIEQAFIKPIHKIIVKKKLPIFYVGPQPYDYPIYQMFLKNDVPVFDFWDYPTKCMNILTKYSRYRERFS